MEITVEDASPQQLNELCKVEQLSFKEEAFSKQQIALLLHDYNSLSLVARVKGEIAGFIIGQIENSDDGLVGHILTLDVLPECRRQGVAQRLLDEIETLFRAKGITESRLEVRVDNFAARRLYRKLGYETVAELANYYQTAHGLYLRKNLRRSMEQQGKL
jgi:ribosomal-protein-alanine acetyltransferase